MIRVLDVFRAAECRWPVLPATTSHESGHGRDELRFETLGQSGSGHPRTLTYCDSIHHLRMADENPCVNVLITEPQLASRVRGTECVVLATDPRRRFFELHERLMSLELLEPDLPAGIGEGCRIHPSAVISPKSYIGDRVVIGAGAVIGDHTVIGTGSFVDAGAKVGVEGMLHRRNEAGDNIIVRHQGGVMIGANCTLLSQAVIVKSVHRGLMTTIADHTIIGINSNIGHEVQIGSNVVVSNNCVVARAARLADHGFVGTSSVIREYVRLDERACVKAGSVVVDDVGPGETVSGNLAINHKDRLKAHARLRASCRDPRS